MSEMTPIERMARAIEAPFDSEDMREVFWTAASETEKGFRIAEAKAALRALLPANEAMILAAANAEDVCGSMDDEFRATFAAMIEAALATPATSA